MRRQIQVEESIAKHAAEFLAREGGTRSLVTVTHAAMSEDLKHATVFVSILPQSQEEESLAYLKRRRSDLHEYIGKHTVLHPIPHVDFELDYGEKNRQRVDELTRRKD